MSSEELVELLFFDTFSHEIHEDINLDLVQFPSPVYITEVRIIPLGARVQADFPGGVRLGATNPSKFGIEFFVNDLGKPGVSTFEKLGKLEYNQNDCINLDCDRIPTDGLVLRGWYSTITLAVYGILTATLNDPIASPPPSELVEGANMKPNSFSGEVVPEIIPNPKKEQLLKVEPEEVPEEKRVHRKSRSPLNEREYKWSRSPEYHRHHLQPPFSRPQSPDESDPYHSPAKSIRIDEDEGVAEPPLEPISDGSDIDFDDEDPYEGEEEPEECESLEQESAIKVFDPYKQPVGKYEVRFTDVLQKDFEEFQLIARKFEKQTKIASIADFMASLSVEKENFVILTEQLLTHFCHVSQSLKLTNFFFDTIFTDRPKNQDLILNVLNISLDYECAKSQQNLHKIRHIKIGIRLAETLGGSDFVLHKKSLNVFYKLFSLYSEDFMALSIKLLILKAISSILDSENGLRAFTSDEVGGFNKVIELMNKEQKVAARTKFALKSILKKINFFDTLESLKSFVNEMFIAENSEDRSDEIERCIQEVCGILTADSASCQQFKRHLPVVRFTMCNDPAAKKGFATMVQNYFKIHSFGECVLLILTNLSFGMKSTLIVAVHDLIEIMMKSQVGIDYLVDDCFETTQLMVNCLLGTDAEVGRDDIKQEPMEDEDDKMQHEEPIISPRSHSLGLQLAFKVQTRYHIDAITYEKDNLSELVEHLHSLYSQTCSHPGRDFTVEVLGINGSLTPFLDLIEKERKVQVQRQQNSPGVKYKSPVLSYSVDILDCCVRHCEDLNYLHYYGKTILDLAKNHEIFEPSVSAVLQEMFVYLKPLEIIDVTAPDEIAPLIELIKRSIEFIANFPGDLIMGLRILKHLCLHPPSAEVELKYRYRLLQFFSLDGVVTLLSILETLNNYFEQPGLHSPTLMSLQGLHCCQIAIPTLEILKEMMTYVIQCRDSEFKDVTAIEQLLRTYYLMYYFPEHSMSYERSQYAKGEIVKIILAYTQPNEKDEEESLTKSLWTQMVREVLKSILSGGLWKYMPGLQLLAELLPLPLPIPSLTVLDELEQQHLLMERKLWSGHLHPERNLIAQLIRTICPTSFPQLLNFLTRVCLQLADLAPNMTLLISKTIIDMIIAEPLSNAVHLARLLNFLDQLTCYASIKISALSIFSGKLYDAFCSIMCSTNEPSEAMHKCQLSVHRILEHCFDSEISVMCIPASENSENGVKELNLACSLPPKELIPGIIEAILKNLLETDIKSPVTLAALRNLIILSEHDITFYHLKKTLINRKIEFQNWITKVLNLHESGDYKGILKSMVLFFRFLLYIEPVPQESNVSVPNRTLKMSIAELASIIGVENSEEQKARPIKRIKDILQFSEDLSNKEALMLDIEDLMSKIEAHLQNPPTEIDHDILSDPPYLPQAESIVTQYSKRPLTVSLDTLEDDNNDLRTMRINYWIEPLGLNEMSDSMIDQIEKVSCDITEVISACLSTDTNLASDCKRILHLSASPQTQKERLTTAPCFRKRRVDLDPIPTSRPDKKMFMPNMSRRGFQRAPPSRGDLFRSRPPNTSRPPSLHVDDFLALETHGAAPTCPTGYNKIPPIIRGGRGRGRGSRISSSGFRTNSPSYAPPTHFRTATSEPVTHFSSDSHYSGSHFGVRSRGRGRVRSYMMQ